LRVGGVTVTNWAGGAASRNRGANAKPAAIHRWVVARRCGGGDGVVWRKRGEVLTFGA
jgi:hypothetical protein